MYARDLEYDCIVLTKNWQIARLAYRITKTNIKAKIKIKISELQLRGLKVRYN